MMLVEETTLDRIEPGCAVRFVKVLLPEGQTRQRVIDMGFMRGAVVRVVRLAPLGDPMQLCVKGYHLSLRLEEARGILVEPIPESELPPGSPGGAPFRHRRSHRRGWLPW